MATDSKDVELRVRVRDLGKKTLDEVSKSLKALGDAQEDQLASAKKGEVSAKALADSYAKIEKAVNALVSQDALTRSFQAQAAALELAKQAADSAADAQTKYANSLVGLDGLTKKQVAQQAALATAVRRTSTAQTNAQNALDGTAAKLATFGIATNDIAGAQARLKESFEGGVAALQRQGAAIESLDDDLKKLAIAAQATAAAQAKADAETKAQADNMLRLAESAKTAAANLAKYQVAAAAANKARSDALVVERAAAQAERDIAAALQVSAQQAEAAARGYATLARTVKSVRGNDLSDQLRLISDPSGEANKNLANLESTIGSLAAKISTINGPVKEFRATLQQLEATQRGVGAIGAQIDAYRRQIDVLRAARTEYTAARSAVTALTAAMRAGGGDAAELGRQMNTAQVALRNAATNMSATVTATRELRDALNKAGVDTAKLASEETRLVDTANKAAGAVNNLTAAFNKHGGSSEKAGRGLLQFGENTRTTLSYTQRLRGELLALATSFVGIQAAIGTATGALDTFKTAQKIEGQLGAAFGTDTKTIRAEWDYLMGAANSIGISFREAAPAYAKFAIATKAFGLNGQETRFIFENLAKASRTAGLSADEFGGVLKAVEQSFSKGTIQAEELRGQLGDRLPGAFTNMAKAMGVTTAELTKLMEAGAVGADEFVNFARTMGQSFAPTATALDGLQASQERFNNSLFEFQLAVANSGFADAYTQLLKDLATLMNSADGKKFAEDLSTAFTGVVTVFRFFIDNIDDVKFALKTLVAVTVSKWAFTAVEGILALGTIMKGLYTASIAASGAMAAATGPVAAVGAAAGTAATGVGFLRAALLLLTRTVPILAAVTTAIVVATYAYDKLFAAKNRAATADNPDGKTGSWDAPKTPFKATEDPASGPDAGRRAQLKFDTEAKKRQEKLDKERKSAMKKSAKDELDERADIIKQEYDLIRSNAKATITDKQELQLRLRDLDKQQNQALMTDKIKFDAEHAKSSAAAANKEIGLQQQVKNELLRIQDEIARDETKADKTSSFDERKKTRLDAIAHSYDKLRKTIQQLSAMDPAGASNATKQLDGYVKQRQAIEAVKVTTEEVTRLEKELTDQQALVNSKLEEQKTLYDAGVISQEQFLANTADINTRADTAIAVAAKNLQTFVDAAVAANAGILSLTQQADIKVKTTKASVPTAKNKNEDADTKAQLEAIDQVVAKRDAAEAIYRQQLALRVITEDEYAAKSNLNADMYKAKILELNDALLIQLETQRAQGILDQTLTPQRLAALDAQIAKQQLLGQSTAFATKQFGQMNGVIVQALGSGIDTALNGLVQGLTDMATGAKSVGEGFRSMAANALQAFATLLQQIALAIAKQMILNSLAAMGGGVGGIAAQLGGAVLHSGGIVGQPNGRSRKVDASWFAAAPRFHEGGMPGIASDEVPAILQKGEQVLSKDDPNNIMNGGGGAQVDAGGVRFVLVDDRSKIPEAMAGADGGRVIVQQLRQNLATIKSLLK